MGMTMTQKILAAHAGLPEVKAGQLIRAKLDMVLGNDITSPVAIREFEKEGFTGVFDKSRVATLPPTRISRPPNSACNAVPSPSASTWITSTMWVRWAWSTPCCRKKA